MHKTLKFKLVTAVIVAFLVAFSVMIEVNKMLDKRDQRTAQLAAATQQNRRLAQRLDQAIAQNQNPEIVLERWNSEIDGQQFLVTPEGGIIANNAMSPAETFAIWLNISGVDTTHLIARKRIFGSDTAIVYNLRCRENHPISDKTSSTCLLYRCLTEGWQTGCIITPTITKSSQTSTLVLLAVSFILLFTVLFYLFIRRCLQPIRLLTNEMSRVSEKNLHLQVPLAVSNDEIGHLTRACKILIERWNLALNSLEITQNELEQSNKTLETKVLERAEQIIRKNRELEQAYQTIRTLSQIGREITSCLYIGDILSHLYEEINKLMICESFAIMTYNPERGILEGKIAIERGQKLPYFEFDISDETRLAVWCFLNKRPIFINCDEDFGHYILRRSAPKVGDEAQSVIYTPIVQNENILGVISVQSFKAQAYTKVHLDMLETLASYTTVAIVNATAYESLQKMNDDLIRTQEQLVLSERMASLGSLTAGIAHEIKNPLNFINNFAALLTDLNSELQEELQNAPLDEQQRANITEILETMSLNAEKILEHGTRANNIVKSMLLHSRGKSGDFHRVDLNNLIAESLNLGYHGMRAQDASFNVKIEENYDSQIPEIYAVPQNMSRVFLNIINNACHAVNERKKQTDSNYSPTIIITTQNLPNDVKISIRDNGKGIQSDHISKIFTPFFTTKPAGKGTGLGLSISYGIIVDEHKGSINVQSKLNEFTEFIITLPKVQQTPKSHD